MDGANDKAELAQLLPKPAEITIAGRKLKLLPFEFDELPDILELVDPFMDDLGNHSPLALFKAHKDRMHELCARLSHQPKEWVKHLPAHEGLRLFNACLGANADFFSQGLRELVKIRLLLPMKSSSNAPSAAASPAESPSPSEPGPGSSTS
jgi:hypothetical protein